MQNASCLTIPKILSVSPACGRTPGPVRDCRGETGQLQRRVTRARPERRETRARRLDRGVRGWVESGGCSETRGLTGPSADPAQTLRRATIWNML